jgi:hypothetical protein
MNDVDPILGHLTDQLNEKLREAERWFVNTFRVPARAERDGRVLSYRKQGGRWGLFVGKSDATDDAPLLESSRGSRVHAALMLEELEDDCEKAEGNHEEAIRAAIAAVDSFLKG